MREKDFLLCVCLSVLVISLPTVYCSGWKPIVPPGEYYATKPKTCISDCNAGIRYPFLDEAGRRQTAETKVKSTILNPSVALNKERGLIQSEKKLGFEIFKPTEVPFFPTGEIKTLDSSLTPYQEVLRQSPSSFFSFKTYGVPGKPAKTIYYGDLELAKPKFTGDIKYYKPYKQNLKTELKSFKPLSFLDNDVNFHQSSKLQQSYNEHCSLYKVSFRQDLYYQYIQYKVHMPELKEFTLCLWMRFHNHSHDHSLFSYGVKHHRQAIYMWVSNLNEPGFFNMKVLGQTIFRLNYPIKLYKWYHTCQSWNGNTGEWQVWVDSHRIGRGFHNLLVNHPIPEGGLAISGQEHIHFGKGFQEIPHFLKGTGGLEGEITMLQLYKIALTTGRAYNDHSHHHSHYTSTTTEPPELPTDEPSTTTDHPLLENGQLKKHVNVLELAEAIKNGQLDTPEHHPSFHSFYNDPLTQGFVSHLAPVALHGGSVNFVGLPTHAIFKRNDETKGEENQRETQAEDITEKKSNNSERIKFLNKSGLVEIKKVTFFNRNETTEPVDENSFLEAATSNITSNTSRESVTSESNSEESQSDENTKTSGLRFGKRLKRQNVQIVRSAGNRTKRITTGEIRPSRFITFGVKKRTNTKKNIRRKAIRSEGKEASKRYTLYEDPYLNFGSVGLTAQDVYPVYNGVPPSGFFYNTFPHFGQEFPGLNDDNEQNINDSLLNNDETNKTVKKEVELAEGEVKRIMEICSGCQLDPFRKVAVISWRSTPKKIYSGTLFLKAKSECENF